VTEPAAPADSDPRDKVREYALPFVIHVEKADPPYRTDAIEAAARATLVFLSDPRVTEADGEWADAVRRWTDGRIRKVVRRARGANWRRAAALPGVTIVHRSAEVRVYPPVPNDDWPPDLSRLQVSGTDLEDPPQEVPDSGPQRRPPGLAPTLPVLYLNPHLSMTAGKAMAQAGHGAQLAWWAADGRGRSAWKDSGFDLAVRTAEPAQWEELLASGLPVVRDGGFTEVEPGSSTVVADLPALRVTRGGV
jgi:peptidyl-tRNA hydrolase